MLSKTAPALVNQLIHTQIVRHIDLVHLVNDSVSCEKPAVRQTGGVHEALPDGRGRCGVLRLNVAALDRAADVALRAGKPVARNQLCINKKIGNKRLR